MAENIERVPYPEHPRRCQGIGRGEQCMIFALPDATHCIMHGGTAQVNSKKAASLKNYQLTNFRAQLERHSGSSNIKSLRDEIGILRMMLETRLNKCHDDMDLMLQSGPIADLVLKIDKLVTSCHKLEGSMGELLDKTSIIQFANTVTAIIAEEVTDPEAMNRIADKIIKAMDQAA